MASQLLEELKQGIETLSLEPAGGGCFEIQVDGNLIYSKLQTGEFPEPSDIVHQVASAAKA